MGVVPGRASGSLRRVRGRASTWTASPESIHKDLEEKIAHIHQQKDAILYPSCFDANAGLFEALLTPEDTILSDELNHASIINGIHLCKTHKYRYLHLDMADLEARLQEAQAGSIESAWWLLMRPFPWTATLHPCRRSAASPLNMMPWSLWTNATPLASWGPQDRGSMWYPRPWVGPWVGRKLRGQPPAQPVVAGCSGGQWWQWQLPS
uniref:Glycine C-acetyltransferase n=1 Tax=Rousettus aegyptiacus TaxID=9407 RepID=A0A7J8JFX7_ROUAE|nr:glycine C-acetyltransferase [Rousettus aegyptiacus]